MDTHIGTSANVPDPAVATPSPATDPVRAAEPAPPLTAHYVLVEDLDHLWRTGISRQILVQRWAR